jgi:hypothetical protein
MKKHERHKSQQGGSLEITLLMTPKHYQALAETLEMRIKAE